MLTRRLFLTSPVLLTGCALLRPKPAPLVSEGQVVLTPSGFTFRWVGRSRRYALPAEVSLWIEAEYAAFVSRWADALKTEPWMNAVLTRVPIQLYRDTNLPSGYYAYTWPSPLQIDVAMDAEGYDAHFEKRTLKGLEWLAHEWRHVLGEKHS